MRDLCAVRGPPRPGHQRHRCPKDTHNKGYLVMPTVSMQRFNQFVDGTVRTDYRDYSPYWQKRLLGKDHKVVYYVSGPSTAAFELLSVDIVPSISYDRQAVIGVRFALRLGKKLSVEDEVHRTPMRNLPTSTGPEEDQVYA